MFLMLIMAGKWEGFTEDDIKNISNNTITGGKLKSSTSVNKHISKHNLYTKKNVTRERMLQGSKYYSNAKSTSEIPKEARLYIPQIPEEEEEEVVESSLFNKKFDSTHAEIKGNVENKVSNFEEPLIIHRTESNENSLSSRNESLLSLNNMTETSLEEFEERQKTMKEQNRLRKEFLKKAIQDRTKKTHAEVRRLNQIEGELKKLDNQLISDVAILRDQIETASLEFMEAQKHFDRSEREYLDAKLALFNKKERKELLTSHLCTIIEHNELRKAKKLSELMEKLEIGNLGSNFLVTRFSVKEEVGLENSQTAVNSDNLETATKVVLAKDEKCTIEKERE